MAKGKITMNELSKEVIDSINKKNDFIQGDAIILIDNITKTRYKLGINGGILYYEEVDENGNSTGDTPSGTPV